MFLGFVSGSSSGRLNLSISQNDLLSLSLSLGSKSCTDFILCVAVQAWLHMGVFIFR